MGQPMEMKGIVKAVPSGDTLLIMGADASKGPPPEKQISLNNVSAPRLGNRNGTPDQPFAWAAREFLRKELIGKRVSFRVEATTPTGREMGSVTLDDTGASVSSLVVGNGWAKVRQGGESRSPDAEELVELGRVAEEQQLGMFATPGPNAVREVNWANTFDSDALLQKLKGAPVDAIIEQAASGSMLRVMLLPSFHQITLLLSGIQCPSIKRAEDGSEDAAPFAREARFFVEQRLLQRDLQVKIEGVDKGGALFGSIVHDKGNMSVELVRCGLARVVDFSIGFCAKEVAPLLRTTEREAKGKRLRLWKDYVPPNHGDNMAAINGRVVEVFSADTLIVADGDGVERRVSLSSVRAPRAGGRDGPSSGDAEAVKNAHYAAEGKELLRRTLIGKKVKVVPEYKRNFAPEGAPPQERTFASVSYGGSDKNVAELLIGEGLALANRAGGGEERSEAFEALIEAEAAAIAAKKGLHSPSPPARAQNIDLTLPTARDRAKSYLSSLQRHGRIRAVVQFMMNAARFKLYVPKEKCTIIFSLAGIRTPQTARAGTEAEPFADEAYAFTRNLCFQREVDIETEAVDKNGTFFGALHLVDKRNLGVSLLEGGLAQRIPPAADRSAHGLELAAAEEGAKKANLKVWENYSEQQAAAAAAAAAAGAAADEEAVPDAQKQVLNLEIVDIVDGAHFYCQTAGSKEVEALQAKLQESSLKEIAPALGGSSKFSPGPGGVCMAKFSQDGAWYRAKVLKKEKGKTTVQFVDYGNKDVATDDKLRPLDPTLSTQVIAPQAIECRLAHLIVQDPSDGADGEEAAITLSESMGKPVAARVEERKGALVYVTLIVDGGKLNLNEKLVSDGLARVEKTFVKKAQPLVEALKEKQNEAKRGRIGMWKYGDIEDDED